RTSSCSACAKTYRRIEPPVGDAVSRPICPPERTWAPSAHETTLVRALATPRRVFVKPRHLVPRRAAEQRQPGRLGRRSAHGNDFVDQATACARTRRTGDVR